jgi:hypothetical protein
MREKVAWLSGRPAAQVTIPGGLLTVTRFHIRFGLREATMEIKFLLHPVSPSSVLRLLFVEVYRRNIAVLRPHFVSILADTF